MILENGTALGITPDVIKRIVCKNDWWAHAPRVFDEQAQSVYDMSYPEEYELGRSMIDYEHESLLREAQLLLLQ